MGGFFTVFFGAPYVPAKGNDIKKAFDDLRPITSGDVVLDLGSGDGKVLREVSRRGGRAVGYELHPVLVAISKWMSRGDARVSVKLGNFWSMAFPDDTTTVYLFGDSRDIAKLASMIQREASRLNRPIDVLSYGFELPGHTKIGEAGAHNLYRVAPLQHQ